MAGLYNHGERKTFQQYCEENPRVAYLLTQWHPTKNGELTPDNVSQSSRTPIWWLCKKGHEWQTQAISRLGGTGCTVCRSELLRERREKKEQAATSKRRVRRNTQ